MFGKVKNRKIIYAPDIYTTLDGCTIFGFNLDEDLMIRNGFKPIIGNFVEYNDAYEKLTIEKITEDRNAIYVQYKKEEK